MGAYGNHVTIVQTAKVFGVLVTFFKLGLHEQLILVGNVGMRMKKEKIRN